MNDPLFRGLMDDRDDMPLSEALNLATDLGTEEGKAAASQVFDGNTDQAAYARVLKGITDGDPLVLDSLPEPAFGDGFITVREVCDEIGVSYDLTSTADQDLIADAFLEEARSAFWHEVERTARYHLEGGEQHG